MDRWRPMEDQLLTGLIYESAASISVASFMVSLAAGSASALQFFSSSSCSCETLWDSSSVSFIHPFLRRPSHLLKFYALFLVFHSHFRPFITQHFHWFNKFFLYIYIFVFWAVWALWTLFALFLSTNIGMKFWFTSAIWLWFALSIDQISVTKPARGECTSYRIQIFIFLPFPPSPRSHLLQSFEMVNVVYSKLNWDQLQFGAIRWIDVMRCDGRQSVIDLNWVFENLWESCSPLFELIVESTF